MQFAVGFVIIKLSFNITVMDIPCPLLKTYILLDDT